MNSEEKVMSFYESDSSPIKLRQSQVWDKVLS